MRPLGTSGVLGSADKAEFEEYVDACLVRFLGFDMAFWRESDCAHGDGEALKRARPIPTRGPLNPARAARDSHLFIVLAVAALALAWVAQEAHAIALAVFLDALGPQAEAPGAHLFRSLLSGEPHSLGLRHENLGLEACERAVNKGQEEWRSNAMVFCNEAGMRGH